MEDLGTLVLSLPRIAPPPPELELLVEDFSSELAKSTPPPMCGDYHGIPCGYRLVVYVWLSFREEEKLGEIQ